MRGMLVWAAAGLAVAVSTLAVGRARAGEGFPPLADVVAAREVEKVVSTTDGSSPFYELHRNSKTGALLAVLPGDYEGKLVMVACTVSGGDAESGVMGPTIFGAWRRYDKQLAFVSPNLGVRTAGDDQAKESIERLYTGRVLFATPILTETEDGRPVIDLGQIALTQAGAIFGASPFGGYGPALAGVEGGIAELTKAKAFPENVIFEYEAPQAGSGVLTRLTWSISALEGTEGYTPRKADNRVGYFYDSHVDYAKPATEQLSERYINRWHVEKADPSLKLSPPKQPIVWYIEHTTPLRYRRYVREGIEMWNRAFEGVGIAGAVEVRQQDRATGAFMEIDPEDARYNFFRWNTSEQGYAIGPSRTNPKTGEILDADVVWHQGLTRAVRNMLEALSNDLVEQAFDAETLAFFAEHPSWDPRVRLADAATQRQMVHGKALELMMATQTPLSDTENHPWTGGLASHQNRACRLGNMLAADLSLAMSVEAAGLIVDDEPKGGVEDASGDESAEKEKADLLDGIPEAFIGPMIRYISAHEVGHCLGLQHNMAASTIRSLEQINTPGFDGPTIGSVMDYAAVNINTRDDLVQGPYATPELGPYDHWAIAFGYGPEDHVEKTLARVAEPDLVYVSQTAMSVGSDPRNMTWDLGANNLDFAASRLGVVASLRGKLVDEITDKGESWATVRRRYQQLLGTHVQALVIASPWIGGTYTNNDEKGDPGDRAPIEDVPPAKQREALALVMDNAFDDSAFGLTGDLVRRFGKEYWWDAENEDELMEDPSATVHDLVGGVQATALTLVMNPSRLRRVYDNEFRTSGDDAFTMAELVTKVTDRVWAEDRIAGSSSFERNLQQEHLGRLIDLALLESTSPTMRAIGTLSRGELVRISERVGTVPNSASPYVKAHLRDTASRIAKALDASYVITR